jgi:thymidine phosphorylase
MAIISTQRPAAKSFVSIRRLARAAGNNPLKGFGMGFVECHGLKESHRITSQPSRAEKHRRDQQAAAAGRRGGLKARWQKSSGVSYSLIANFTSPVSFPCPHRIQTRRSGAHRWRSFVKSFSSAVAAEIPDYQLAAFLMAVFFSGLNTAETTALTLAMRDSGDVLRFPKTRARSRTNIPTGGVGDKVSLPLAPLLACLGFRVPMISGRGLAPLAARSTNSIPSPASKRMLPTERITENRSESVGCVICGQDRIAWSRKTKKLLRPGANVTGTPGQSLPLITASILSKKLAESLDALVLVVTFGSAAFMTDKVTGLRTVPRRWFALGNRVVV